MAALKCQGNKRDLGWGSCCLSASSSYMWSYLQHVFDMLKFFATHVTLAGLSISPSVCISSVTLVHPDKVVRGRGGPKASWLDFGGDPKVKNRLHSAPIRIWVGICAIPNILVLARPTLYIRHFLASLQPYRCGLTGPMKGIEVCTPPPLQAIFIINMHTDHAIMLLQMSLYTN